MPTPSTFIPAIRQAVRQAKEARTALTVARGVALGLLSAVPYTLARHRGRTDVRCDLSCSNMIVRREWYASTAVGDQLLRVCPACAGRVWPDYYDRETAASRGGPAAPALAALLPLGAKP